MGMTSEKMDGGGAFLPELGVRRSLIEGLTIKTLHFLGEATTHDLAKQMCISPAIVDGIFQRMRKEQLVQATGMSQAGHRIMLTAAGRQRALELLNIDQYVGAAPVSLEDYIARVDAQTVRDFQVTPDEVHKAFAHLVLDEGMLSQLGTAVVSGRAIFLYGPPGTGKTTVAQTLANLFRRDHVWIPYAVDVDGQIITVFDAHVHEPVQDAAPTGGDARWILCRRPSLVVGGELTIDMLDLQFNPTSRYYTAPVQMRANNGFLIVDDFGRQRIQPAEMLNRWVVPLDRRVDYLQLAGGKKLQIPFDLFVVFATNLDPAKVIEEAFLRRIQTKIKLGSVTPDQFHEIFRRVCDEVGLEYQEELVDRLIGGIGSEYNQPLRPCYPRDIVNQIVWRAKYEQRQAVLNAESLGMACRGYFLAPD